MSGATPSASESAGRGVAAARARRAAPFAAFVLAALAAAAAPPKARGLWFWSKPSSPDGSVNIVGRPEREAETIAFFERWNIRRVYGGYGELPKTAPEAMGAWNRNLHAHGIRSEMIFDDWNAIFPAGRPALFRMLDERLLNFDVSRPDPEERFDGAALDIEPQALPAWKKSTAVEKRAILENYLGMCGALRGHLDIHGGRDLTLSAALAIWYYRLPPEGSIGWKSPSDRDDWFNLLSTSVTSVSLMAYERSGVEAIDAGTRWERENFKGRTIISLRARLGQEWKSLADLKKVIPGVEALQSEGIDIENFELLRKAEGLAKSPRSGPD